MPLPTALAGRDGDGDTLLVGSTNQSMVLEERDVSSLYNSISYMNKNN